MVAVTNPTGEIRTAIKQQLRYTNPAYVRHVRFGNRFGEKPKQFVNGYIYEEDNDRFWVPRAWYYQTIFGLVNKTTPLTVEVPCDVPEPALTPLPHQFDALSAFIATVNDNDRLGRPTDTYICLPPSEGKTILGMFAIHCCSQKALVVVPTKEIEEAWVKDATKAFPGMALGSIRGKTVDCDSPITVGSIQTLMDLDPSLWSEKFGFVLFDEVHRVAAEKFANTVKRCRANIRLGLTATDFRKDGRFISVRWHLGNPCFKTEERTNSVPLVYHAVFTKYGITEKKLNKNGAEVDPDFNDLLASLQNNAERNRSIADLTCHILDTEPGDVLIVSPRTEHIAEIVNALHKKGIYPAIVTSKTPKRKKLFKDICGGLYKVTIATTSIMSEGASNPLWHHVISTMPFSDPKTAIQLSGRAIRKREGKFHGIFWDLVDVNPMARSMYVLRWKAIRRFLKTTRVFHIPFSAPFSLLEKKG